MMETTPRRPKTLKERIVIIVSIVSFLGTTLFGMYSLRGGIERQEKPVLDPAAVAAQEQETLQAQIKGYQLVLEREPQNQVALEGLANAQLQANDAKGAIATLEKLVSLYPDRSDYKTVLAEVKQKAGNP